MQRPGDKTSELSLDRGPMWTPGASGAPQQISSSRRGTNASSSRCAECHWPLTPPQASDGTLVWGPKGGWVRAVTAQVTALDGKAALQPYGVVARSGSGG